MGRITSKSKIVPISRFDIASLRSPDFISGTFDSDILVSNKGINGKKNAKLPLWLIKKHKNVAQFNAEQQFNHAIKNRCEIFSAWQYESFIGDGSTQPKYYLVRGPLERECIASKLVPGYTSMNVLINKKTGEEKTVLLQPKNLKALAQMLINYLWLAASDFKLDHIGVDSEGRLVCLDFGESLIPFQYQESVYQSRGWNFLITSQDLLSAPFFSDYQSSHFFIERATESFPGIFDFLRDNPALKHELCIAILKRCIFPNFISFAALELFNEFEDCGVELQAFMTKRTSELLAAAIQNPVFLEFMHLHGAQAFEAIKSELLDGGLAQSRYFRKNTKDYRARCLEELHDNFKQISMVARFSRFESINSEAVIILRMLREFCHAQYLRLKQLNETTFFKKGLTDKTRLVKQLLDKIDQTPFENLSPDALAEFIHRLMKETAIIAHHRRYSKINTFFGHTESASWKDFTAFFSRYTGHYLFTVQAVLNDKKSRSIVMMNNEAPISGYNEYREAMITQHKF